MYESSYESSFLCNFKKEDPLKGVTKGVPSKKDPQRCHNTVHCGNFTVQITSFVSTLLCKVVTKDHCTHNSTI